MLVLKEEIPLQLFNKLPLKNLPPRIPSLEQRMAKCCPRRPIYKEIKRPFPFKKTRWPLSTPISTVSMPRRKIRAHYEQMSEFETGRVIGLKEAGWSNRLIARYLCRSDAAIRRCWQNIQRQDGSGRPRATTEREDRAIVRMAVAAPESTLSTFQRVTGTQVSKMAINRRLRERNLRACRLLGLGS
ncbi:hypothetical protein LAZ67_19002733 [Cordylochernes scorpioides]|uniref:Transposase IS30-like HTH domain-containing protein n=1 Tax=Cordylochernes scorpioides TaxID=51811 RepID=A0ABY6LIS5_9ARAC|nr:hypothetical protein LAZ67_19002733 [Cordylochernes scorpioides]